MYLSSRHFQRVVARNAAEAATPAFATAPGGCSAAVGRAGAALWRDADRCATRWPPDPPGGVGRARSCDLRRHIRLITTGSAAQRASMR